MNFQPNFRFDQMLFGKTTQTPKQSFKIVKASQKAGTKSYNF
jgi:hypothetical protein